ncbi:MAG: transcriptional regulator, GntR family [Peptococcaceae bacterium]|jgi:DNA-binding GntR family transcriptional regulator|nr:transcriptional regulator, GntR family [Peptococcaceae bacterium]
MENVLFKEVNISQVKPIRDIVYESLRAAILEGKLKPGERLVEKDIAEKFNISRTPVREALRKLEIEGFLEYIPRKGDIVKAIDKGEIKEIYAIRKALECLAISSVIENITAQEISQLEQLLADAEQLEKEGKPDKVFEASQRFNEVLLSASKMPKLIGLINNMKEQLERLRRITMSRTERRKEVIKEHKAILQAVVARDYDKATELVVKHLEASMQTLLSTL